MVGPCLCGDPYCAACGGNPDLIVLEEAVDKLWEMLAESDLQPEDVPTVLERFPGFLKEISNASRK